MNLETTINVTAPVTAGSSKTGIMRAYLTEPIRIGTSVDLYDLGLKYTIEEEGIEYDVLMADSKPKMTATEFQTVYDAVKTGLPSEDDMLLRLRTLGLEIIRVKMVEQFGELTNVSEISIV